MSLSTAKVVTKRLALDAQETAFNGSFSNHRTQDVGGKHALNLGGAK
jgi:hypothetical protein